VRKSDSRSGHQRGNSALFSHLEAPAVRHR
jgi:hypothetical protein